MVLVVATEAESLVFDWALPMMLGVSSKKLAIRLKKDMLESDVRRWRTGSAFNSVDVTILLM